MSQDNFWKGVLAGAVAGVIGGILLAPKSGQETREDIAKYYVQIKRDLIKELEKLQKFTKETYDDVVNKIVDRYEHDKKIGIKEATKVKKELKNGYENVKKAVKDIETAKK